MLHLSRSSAADSLTWPSSSQAPTQTQYLVEFSNIKVTKLMMATDGEILVPCGKHLDTTLAFFVDELCFRVILIYPADAPNIAVVTGHGLRLRLSTAPITSVLRLRLLSNDHVGSNRPRQRTAPNGTIVDFAPLHPSLPKPPLQLSLVVTTASSNAFHEGRAGMLYRDLVPDRLGGRFIASHIHIPKGGPVPDYTHFHDVEFQLIVVAAGWVRVVYEDQGAPFVMRRGDCVLQPPGIRHRVLESSDALHVIEVGLPATHATSADLKLELPNTTTPHPQRVYGRGQRFVRHVASAAPWKLTGSSAFETQETGVATATDDRARVSFVRRNNGLATYNDAVYGCGGDKSAEFVFVAVLSGTGRLMVGKRSWDVRKYDAAVVPKDAESPAFHGCSADFEMLQVVVCKSMFDENEGGGSRVRLAARL